MCIFRTPKDHVGGQWHSTWRATKISKPQQLKLTLN